MKLVLTSIVIILLAVASQYFLPWWHIVPAAFLGALIIFPNHAVKSFVSGFVAIALFWGVYAGMLNSGNEGILASKIAGLLKANGPVNLILGTAVLGGLLGGFGAMSGDLGRQLITNKKK